MDSLEVEKFIVVVLLKLYKSHLLCCRQSYDVRPNVEYTAFTQPIFYYFTKLANLSDLSTGDVVDNINCGPVTSADAYCYVAQNKRLLKYHSIRYEYNQISKMLRHIMRKNKEP